MTDDRAGSPGSAPREAPRGAVWGDLTYRGSSAPGASPPQPAGPARRPIPRSALVGGGVAAAVALGLIGGLWARPDLGHSKLGQPMRAVTPDAEEATSGPTMAIEVARPRPEPGGEPKAAGKLEVLPPGLARAAAPAPLPATAPPQTVPLDPPRAPPADAAPPTAHAPQVNVAPLAAPPLPAQAQMQSQLQAAARLNPPPIVQNGCGGATSRAAQMVCADPELAAADRELSRAYRRALRSGASPELLRRDQRDWLAIREDAARQSPRALAQVYAQRIDELNEAADVTSDDGPGV